MKISASRLIRWSGLSAVAAGLIFAGIQPFHPAETVSAVTTDLWATLCSFKTVMSILGVFGVAGLYSRHVEQTGWLGLAGYLSLTVFYAVQMCYSFAETLMLPLMTTAAPKLVESLLTLATGAPSEIDLGALAPIYSMVGLLYLVGNLLFGIALFRARILSRWASLLLACSGPLAILLKLVLGHPLDRLAAVPMGLALAWLGWSLWFEPRRKAS